MTAIKLTSIYINIEEKGILKGRSSINGVKVGWKRDIFCWQPELEGRLRGDESATGANADDVVRPRIPVLL